MAMKARLDTSKLQRRFRAMPEKVREQMQTQFAAGATDMVQMARRLAPKKSGDLAESITWNWGFQARVKYSQGGGGKASGRAGVMNIRYTAGNAQVRYAHIVEFGASPHVAGGIFKGAAHPGTPAQPYFFPAYRAKRRAFKIRTKRALKKGIVASKGA